MLQSRVQRSSDFYIIKKGNTDKLLAKKQKVKYLQTEIHFLFRGF